MALSPIAQWLATNYTTMASSTAYPLQIDADIEVLARLGASFAPSQTPTASMQIILYPGHLFDGTTLTEVGQYTTATTVSGNASVAVVRAEGIAAGQLVIGAGVPSGTTVSAVSGTTVTLSANATASASNVPLAFCQLSATITAPAAGNNRIDRVVVSRSTGAVSIVTGTPTSGVPTAPAITAGTCPAAQVSLTSSTTTLTNTTNISDERDLTLLGMSFGAAAFLGLGTGLSSGGGNITPQCAATTVSGSSHGYVDGDRNQLLSRSNSGTAMTDTFGGASTPLAAGWATIIANADASATLTFTIQSGTGTGGFSSPSLGSGFVSSSTLSIPAGGILRLISQGNGVYIAWNLTQASTGINSTTFTSSTTWAVPAGVTQVKVRLWGGGGGSGATFGSSSGSAGGGGGGYAEGIVTGLTPGANIAITVGAGGTAGATSGSPSESGGAGSSSSFGSYLSATGGAGGVPANGGVAISVSSGGTGSGGSILNVAGGTSDSAFSENGGSVVTASGAGSYGTPAQSCLPAPPGFSGIAGIFPGGGASGSANAANGGAGANGYVIVEWQ